jgi:hypothetical protein
VIVSQVRDSLLTMATDPLMTPFSLKTLTLRNRIVGTSHEPAYSEDGLPKDRYRAYHVEKARGGVALTMIGPHLQFAGQIKAKLSVPVMHAARLADVATALCGRGGPARPSEQQPHRIRPVTTRSLGPPGQSKLLSSELSLRTGAARGLWSDDVSARSSAVDS